MITVETDLFNAGRKIGYSGYGDARCPYCNEESDVGTGEHANPDITLCHCGKWFRYWLSGCTQRIAKSRQAKLNEEMGI